MSEIISIATIVQALVIAAICAAATAYVSGKVMEVKINGLREAIKRFEEEQKAIRARLHEWAPHIGWVEQQRRWEGNDRREKK